MRITNNINPQYIYNNKKAITSDKSFADTLLEKAGQTTIQPKSQPQPITARLACGGHFISYEHLPAMNVDYQRNLTAIMYGNATVEILPAPKKTDSLCDINIPIPSLFPVDFNMLLNNSLSAIGSRADDGSSNIAIGALYASARATIIF